MADEEMDSLFEGMMLFTPSQLAEAEPEPEPEPESEPEKQPLPLPPSTPLPEPDHNLNSPSDQRASVAEPLDENLFSDVTLVLPQQPILPEPSISRQSSRKKKKATGFRVGYGRDNLQRQHSDEIDNGKDEGDESQGKGEGYETFEISDEKAAEKHDNLSSSWTPPQPPLQTGQDTDTKTQFERVKSEIAHKLDLARQLVASVSAARKDAIRRRRKVAADLHLATVGHSKLENELEAACEAEDFEAADRISESLAVAENNKHALLASLRDAEAQCDAIESKMLEALLSLISAEEECATLLHCFSKEAITNADSILKNNEVRALEERERWLSSNEALEFKKIELEIETDIVNDASGVFNSSIDDLIADDKKEREILCNKKDKLAGELAQLLALVKEKEKEIAHNDESIQEVEQRISSAVCGFEDLKLSMNAKCDALRSSISLMNEETEDLFRKKKEIDIRFSEEQQKGTKLRDFAITISDEAKSCQETVELRRSLIASVLKSVEDKVGLGKTEEKLSEDLRVLQHDVSAARASLQELTSSKSSMQQSIASFKQRLLFIDKRIPELEADKKVAAGARNFKEAARIAAEAKSLTAEKDEIMNELEKADIELVKLEEEIKCTTDRVEKIEGLILSMEKDLAIARYQRLVLTAGAAKANSLAALELGDVEEANLLSMEAEAADAEANELQPKYNLNEEDFASLPKHFISMELVANLGRKELVELSASVHPAAS